MIKHAKVSTIPRSPSTIPSPWPLVHPDCCKWLDLPLRKFYAANTTLLLQSFLSREISCGDVRLNLPRLLQSWNTAQCEPPLSLTSKNCTIASWVGANKMKQLPKSVRWPIYKEKMSIFMEKKYQTSLKLPRCQWRTSAREKQRSQNSGLASKLLSGGRTSHSMHWNRRLGGSVVKDELQLEQRMQAQSGEKQHSAPP